MRRIHHRRQVEDEALLRRMSKEVTPCSVPSRLNCDQPVVTLSVVRVDVLRSERMDGRHPEYADKESLGRSAEFTV